MVNGTVLSINRILRSSASWHNLGKFVTGSSAQEQHWNNLKSYDSAVHATIDSVSSVTDSQDATSIDWSKWEDRITHKNILKHMKETYLNTMNTIDSALKLQNPPTMHSGWEMYDSVKDNCLAATKAADKIISDGIKALWISQNNPPVHKVDTNEWLESDQYWQAFVEKHAMYSQSGTSNDPESPAEIESVKNKWNTNVYKFNERTDTPILYDYMNHLPSWEFYDVNRKQFFEHMEYFLLRTGEDFRHFPDIPKWYWLTHLEDIRYKIFTVSQRRQFKRQVESLSREETPDMQDSEDANYDLLLHEKHNTESTLSKLMANYSFLCDPLIPVQNLFQLSYVLSKDGYESHKGTQVYTFGDDVNALFVLPHGSNISANDFVDSTQVTPLECFYSLMDHLNLSGIKVNPTYATRLECQMEVIQQRGPNWLKLRNETSLEAFLRRLRHDDPLKPHYLEYAKELTERIANAKLVPVEQWVATVKAVEKRVLEQEEALRSLSTESTLHLGKDEIVDFASKNWIIAKDPVTNKVVKHSELLARL
ncbi:conserved hypothetical protein [Theileria equi strain WA]|uniref:Uncharacterized protein n=1 Tax=Theileria equi strain WA TaxID=1537102 RepID=L1L9Z1_THEEQ|nr:conserved hypothetical protein [Theileria equi strain WA]EKX71978.1 conserved hypothetical protein [Theileria equi strain WA]|eukprot:XP_004831430.1 conserved hypothetical protein [Theileria equi strain WA]